jgi:hypothetical protein
VPEERTNQVRPRCHLGQLQLDAIFEVFPGAQRTPGVAGALGVTPDQLVSLFWCRVNPEQGAAYETARKGVTCFWSE